MARRRLPGNRVIKRRLNATEIIPLPQPHERREAPSPHTQSRQFVFAFIVVMTLGTFFLTLPVATETGERTGLVDALFTAVSAVAVTGLVVVETQEHWSFVGELVIIVLI